MVDPANRQNLGSTSRVSQPHDAKEVLESVLAREIFRCLEDRRAAALVTQGMGHRVKETSHQDGVNLVNLITKGLDLLKRKGGEQFKEQIAELDQVIAKRDEWDKSPRSLTDMLKYKIHLSPKTTYEKIDGMFNSLFDVLEDRCVDGKIDSAFMDEVLEVLQLLPMSSPIREDMAFQFCNSLHDIVFGATQHSDGVRLGREFADTIEKNVGKKFRTYFALNLIKEVAKDDVEYAVEFTSLIRKKFTRDRMLNSLAKDLYKKHSYPGDIQLGQFARALAIADRLSSLVKKDLFLTNLHEYLEERNHVSQKIEVCQSILENYPDFAETPQFSRELVGLFRWLNVREDEYLTDKEEGVAISQVINLLAKVSVDSLYEERSESTARKIIRAVATFYINAADENVDEALKLAEKEIPDCQFKSYILEKIKEKGTSTKA